MNNDPGKDLHRALTFLTANGFNWQLDGVGVKVWWVLWKSGGISEPSGRYEAASLQEAAAAMVAWARKQMGESE